MNVLFPNRPTLLTMVVVTLLAGFLRGFIVHSEMLWLDELHTSWTVGGLWSDVMPRAVDGNQQPLFFWLTRFSTSLFGHNTLSLRLVSFLAGMGTLLTASWLTWHWSRSAIAMIVVTILIALDGQFLFYASESRPYSLVQWLGVVQVILFFRALESKAADDGWRQHRPDWSLAVVSMLLVYTHLTSVWLLGVEGIFFLVYFARSNLVRRSAEESSQRGLRLSRFLATAAVTLMGLVPAFIQTQAIMSRKGNWESVSSLEKLLLDSYPWLFAMIGLPVLFLVVAQVIQNERRTGDVVLIKPFVARNVWRMLFVFAWAIAPIVWVAALDHFEVAPLALLRYTIVGSAAFPVFAGLCIGCLAGKGSRIALAILIVVVSSLFNPLVQAFVLDRQWVQFRTEDWQSPIAQINFDESRQHLPVFLFANVIEDGDALINLDARFQAYLLFPVGGLYEVHPQGRYLAAGPTLAVDHFSEAYINRMVEQGGAWILIRADRKIVDEIQEGLRTQLAQWLKKDPEQIQFMLYGTADGPMYLLSVDL